MAVRLLTADCVRYFLTINQCFHVPVLAVRADKCSVTTLEGLQEEAAEFVTFIADQGAEQCGFCNPGFVMNAIALFRRILILMKMR